MAKPAVAEAPTEAAAMQAALAQGFRVEVAAHATESTKVYANPTGTFTLEQSVMPNRVRQGGRWADVDATLMRHADGSVRPKATLGEVSFSAGGSGPLLRISNAGKEIRLGWRGELPAPSLAGETATYAEVLPGVDLRVRATLRGFAHELVVKTRTAALDPALAAVTFDVGVTGVRLVADEAGNLQALDDAGALVYQAPAPEMWDSSESPRRSRVDVRLDAGQLTLLPDRELLNNPDIRFPLVIDPDMSYITPERAGWTLTRRSHAGQQNWNIEPRDEDERIKGVVRVGRETDQNGTYLDRSFFKFDLDPNLLRGARIEGRTTAFQVFQTWKETNTCDPSTVDPVLLYLAGDMGPGSSWNNQPPLLGEPLSSIRTTAKLGQSCGPDWVSFGIGGMIQKVANESWGGINLGMRASNETSYAGWKRFHSKVQDGYRYYPRLHIEFNRPPHAPQWVATDPDLRACRWCDGVRWTGNDWINLNAKIDDPDGGQLRAIWDIATPEHQWREQWLGANSVYSTALDLRGLHDRTVNWRVRGNDGEKDGPISDGPSFAVDRVSPDKPPVVAGVLYQEDNAWHGGVDVPDTFTFTANGVSDIDHYVYGFADPPSTPVDADALGGKASIQITPPRDGPVDLYVQSVDRAGRRSPTKTYHFYVRPGGGPASQWALEGNAKDDSPLGGRHGTVHGQLTWAPGAVGAAAGFNGSDAAISAAHTVNTAASFTVSAWVRPERIGPADQTVISQDGNRVGGFLLQLSKEGRWQFVAPGGDGDEGDAAHRATAMAAGSARPGQWAHVAGVADLSAQRISLYVNGTLADTVRYTGRWNAAGDLQIGRGKWRGGHTGYWAGCIDEVRVHDRVLSAASIRALVSRDNVQLGHWKFDDKDGTTARNVVDSGQIGQLVNGAFFQDRGGAIGGAVKLDGVDDFVRTHTSVVDTDRSFTVSAWVKLDRLAADGGAATVISQDGEQNSGFMLQQRGTSWMFGMLKSTGGQWAGYAASAADTAQVGVWTHLVGVYDHPSKEIRLSVNGQQVGAGQVIDGWNSTGPLVVGRATFGGGSVDHLAGAVDELRLYSRSLVEEEIRGIVSRDDVAASSWQFDGNTDDESGRGRHAAARGVPGWTAGQGDSPDPRRLAIHLDGVDDHVVAPVPADTSKSFSVAGWVKLTDKRAQWASVVSANGKVTSAFNLGYTGKDLDRWVFALHGSDSDNPSSVVRLETPQAVQQGVWTHLAGVYDAHAGQARLYVNGVLAASGAFAGGFAATEEFDIGRARWRTSWLDYFPGAVDNVKTYSRALFEDEARLLAGRDLSLVHNLRLDEPHGATAADSTGARPGTLGGGATFTSGRAGNAVTLNGTTAHVSTKGADLRTDDSFTVTAWVNLKNKNGQVTAVSMDGKLTSKFRLGHVVDGDERPLGAWVFEMPESDAENAPVTKAALSTLKTELDTWVHLVGVYEKQTKKLWLYVNGDRIGDGTLNTPWQAGGGLQIGRAKASSAYEQYWPGSVDDVRLYTGGLDRQRISTMYQSYADASAKPVPKAVPADGVTVRDERGAVFKFVGGAPVWLSSCAVDCGTPAHIPNWRIDQLDSMNAVPADGATMTDERHRIYKVVGGAPVQLANCNAGCGTPVRVNDRSVDELNHMNAVPSTGATAKDERNRVYMFVGGAPVRVDDCGAPCGTPVPLTDPSLDTFNHMNRKPTNGTLLRAPDAVIGRPTSVWVIAGGARVKFGSEKELLDSGYRWADVRPVPEKVLLLLPTDILDGTVLRSLDSPSTPQTVWVVVRGARAGFDTGKEFTDAGRRWEEVVQLPWRVVEQMPLRIPDNAMLRAADAPDPQATFLVVGGARLWLASNQEMTRIGRSPAETVVIPWRVLGGLSTTVADGTLVRVPEATQVWRIQGGKRWAITEWGDPVRVIPQRILDSYPVATA
ncbi:MULTISPECIES: LamG-like jellyroll fold domain-containing protein [unclassified Crossiella]|uniref:LamG-like jellyroll fold domain-containing protein n=1 Tax=unclassified Crossiella TaxID=2620835 RepID=UPI001FFF9A78|nr:MULTISPECIES: LamG-like jellyroll fold domain-containing protein [unclassified Crossiella]MCK2238988.1 LamG domain-containing protein [Crossiella sp. S99.2]MCK2251443.1 LamG domain-containing protein [Crossiella sp. S99.1]